MNRIKPQSPEYGEPVLGAAHGAVVFLHPAPLGARLLVASLQLGHGGGLLLAPALLLHQQGPAGRQPGVLGIVPQL